MLFKSLTNLIINVKVTVSARNFCLCFSYFIQIKNIIKQKGNNSARTNRRTTSESKLNESIVKDLERPNSEMNIHSSNLLRNSFILEENEEEPEIVNVMQQDELNKKTIHKQL